MRSIVFAPILFLLAASALARATVVAAVHGVVHNRQHRPVAGALVALQSVSSSFSLSASTATNGEFDMAEVPIGVYKLRVTASGFAAVTQIFTVALPF